ncbi:MAG: hypothetical protein AMJ53_11035 [Gammaproteobacteria bacterium SG8_11]|nr:MAG: hypothetical protein AMJ53_11035 [Gammaproteobacteria bacterium SG8_11]
MYKLAIIVCAIVIGGCATSSFSVPVGWPVVVKDEDGSAVRQCQVVIVDGEPKTECANLLSMFY